MAENPKIDKLRKLQQKYIGQLPDKTHALNNAWLKILHNCNNEYIIDLIQLAHNLAGSAGTFGFPAISTEARELENTLRNVTNAKELINDKKKSIDDALIRIQALADLGPDVEQHAADQALRYLKPASKSTQPVYIIDDDELLSAEIASQLAFFDYKTETFNTLALASQAVKRQLPSAMIVDIQLPEGDLAGSEFGMLFNEYSSVRVPMIFISARDDWAARLSAVRANGTAYLTKPLDFNELVEQLDLITFKQQPEPYRILIVDDMEVLAEHYAQVLQNDGMDVKVISDPSDLLEMLSDYQPELIIMDVYMPQCSGLEAAAIIRQKAELISIPIVFLSTEADPLKHLTAMELGGDDFLQKPILDDNLLIAVKTRAHRFRSLRGHMHKDGLTGLLNHVTIKTQLESEISRAQRQSEPLTFAMIDIDHFKHVNDTYGHPVGDRVIKSISRMLIKRLRKSDIIGRYGGEEFAIILPGTNLDTAMDVLNNIRETFSQISQQTNEVQFNCTFSTGLAQLTKDCTAGELVRRADVALYEAKNSGRNKVCAH